MLSIKPHTLIGHLRVIKLNSSCLSVVRTAASSVPRDHVSCCVPLAFWYDIKMISFFALLNPGGLIEMVFFHSVVQKDKNDGTLIDSYPFQRCVVCFSVTKTRWQRPWVTRQPRDLPISNAVGGSCLGYHLPTDYQQPGPTSFYWIRYIIRLVYILTHRCGLV